VLGRRIRLARKGIPVMRRIQLSSRALRVTGASAALLVAVTVPAVANAAANAVPTLPTVTCVKASHAGDNWQSGYCVRGGTQVAYQEHIVCSNGHTYDGNIAQSSTGSPESRATCAGH
jgi:hypothetical protein